MVTLGLIIVAVVVLGLIGLTAWAIGLWQSIVMWLACLVVAVVLACGLIMVSGVDPRDPVGITGGDPCLKKE